MGSLFLMSIREMRRTIAGMMMLTACAPSNEILGSETLQLTSAEQAINLMVAEGVANRRALQIVRACEPLQLDRAAIRQHKQTVRAAIDRLIEENPDAAFELAEKMGLPVDQRRSQKSTLVLDENVTKESTSLNSRLLADFGGRVLVASAAAPSSESCADGAREIDGGTLVGSFLKPVNNHAD